MEEREREQACIRTRDTRPRVYACVIVSVLRRRLGVPNLALPNGKPGVLAGLLRRPARSLEPSILHLLLQK